jgi:hypothetical protein
VVRPAEVRPARAKSAIALLLALAMMWQGLGLFQRDLAFIAVETEVSFWGEGSYQPTAAKREWAGRQLDALLAETPANPDYQLLAASYHAWQAYWAQDPELEQQYTHKAEQAQYAARQARPAYLRDEQAAID